MHIHVYTYMYVCIYIYIRVCIGTSDIIIDYQILLSITG